MIDLPRLIACGIEPSIARPFVEPLSETCERFGIATTNQQAGFIAQAMHESRNFAGLEERLTYLSTERILAAFSRLGKLPMTDLRGLVKNPKALALAAYSRMYGNGDPSTMDGWTYRGGGPFQLTFRDNYAACGIALGLPLVEHPELIRMPSLASALSAGWYWDSRKCNEAMEQANGIDAVTRLINGPRMLGRNERRTLYFKCREALA